MKLFGALWSCLGFTVFVFILIATPTPSSALIEDALDVFHVVKEVTTAVLKAWDLVQTSPLGSNINFPLMREKQRKVLSRLKEVSKQITKTEDQVSVGEIMQHLISKLIFYDLFPISSMLNKLLWPFNRLIISLRAICNCYRNAMILPILCIGYLRVFNKCNNTNSIRINWRLRHC